MLCDYKKYNKTIFKGILQKNKLYQRCGLGEKNQAYIVNLLRIYLTKQKGAYAYQ